MTENGDLILSYLERLGVKYVFGVPGGSIEPFYNALARSEARGGPRCITARHETGAAFMADGYARESGRLGVCCATAGPGATNLITGVASAYADGTPMLVITAQTSIEKFGAGALQETSCTGINTLEMFEHCTRYNTLVSHPAQLEAKLLQAISQAFSNHPGPVHLSIPLDVMKAAAQKPGGKGPLKAFLNHETHPSQKAMQLVLKELAPFDKVTVVIGEGAQGAVAELMGLIESRGWLFVSTPRGKGLVNSYHPNYRGVFGFAGHSSASEALRPENADRVVVVGTALDEVSTGGWDDGTILSDRLIHLSNNPEHLNRSYMARLVVLGSIELMLKPFAEMMERDPQRRKLLPERNDAGLPKHIAFDEDTPSLEVEGSVSPRDLMIYLSRSCPAETRVVMDSGNSFLWGIHYWNFERPDTLPADTCLFHTGIGFASMGWAIGAAVGIASANPQVPVVCVTGDGSYLMSGQELTTAFQENQNLLMIVLNDASLGMVRHGQRLGGAASIAHELPEIDFATLGKSLGIESYLIESLCDLQALDLADILARKGPCLLDVRVRPEQVPPMGARMKVLAGRGND